MTTFLQGYSLLRPKLVYQVDVDWRAYVDAKPHVSLHSYRGRTEKQSRGEQLKKLWTSTMGQSGLPCIREALLPVLIRSKMTGDRFWMGSTHAWNDTARNHHWQQILGRVWTEQGVDLRTENHGQNACPKNEDLEKSGWYDGLPLAAQASAFCCSCRSILRPSSLFLKWWTLLMIRTRGRPLFCETRRATFSSLSRAENTWLVGRLSTKVYSYLFQYRDGLPLIQQLAVKAHCLSLFAIFRTMVKSHGPEMGFCSSTSWQSVICNPDRSAWGIWTLHHTPPYATDYATEIHVLWLVRIHVLLYICSYRAVKRLKRTIH